MELDCSIVAAVVVEDTVVALDDTVFVAADNTEDENETDTGVVVAVAARPVVDIATVVVVALAPDTDTVLAVAVAVAAAVAASAGDGQRRPCRVDSSCFRGCGRSFVSDQTIQSVAVLCVLWVGAAVAEVRAEEVRELRLVLVVPIGWPGFQHDNNNSAAAWHPMFRPNRVVVRPVVLASCWVDSSCDDTS